MRIAWVLIASACGRIRYDPIDAGAPGEDAPSAVAASFEAESAVVTPMFEIFADPAASGGQYLVDNNGVGLTGPGTATITFSLAKSATYFIWGRGRTADASTDSFFVAIDGAARMPYDISECIHGSVWHWTVIRLFTANCPMIGAPVAVGLGAGSHTLRLTSREGQSAIDRFILTDDPVFVPTD
jgi:hypothetical protein